MAAQTRKRRALDLGTPVRRPFEQRAVERERRRPPVKSLWSWIFTMLLLGLIGLFLGILFGGAISA